MYVAFISWMLEVLTIICKKKKKLSSFLPLSRNFPRLFFVIRYILDLDLFFIPDLSLRFYPPFLILNEIKWMKCLHLVLLVKL